MKWELEQTRAAMQKQQRQSCSAKIRDYLINEIQLKSEPFKGVKETGIQHSYRGVDQFKDDKDQAYHVSHHRQFLDARYLEMSALL